MKNIRGKFHGIPSTKYIDIALHETRVNGRTTDGRTTGERIASAAYCWRRQRCFWGIWAGAGAYSAIPDPVDRFEGLLATQGKDKRREEVKGRGKEKGRGENSPEINLWRFCI